MLSQDEIDKLLSSLSVGLDTPEPSASAPAASHDSGHGGHAAAHAGDFSSVATATAQREDGPTTIYEKRNFKLYNFRRPDKFSKDHLRALQTIHENFARQLALVMTAYLRMTVEIDVVSVDQLTYDEFIRTMPSPMTVSILEMDPLPGQTLLGLSYEVTSGIIDRMLGGRGNAVAKPRELTDIEQSLIRRVLDRALATLEEAWRSVVNVAVNPIGMEESYALIQVASGGEIVALITFEVNLGNKDSGLMSLCLPYPVLEGVISQLSAQHIFHRQQSSTSSEHQEEVITKLSHARLPLQVLLGGTTLSVRELLSLNVGDVVRLDREAKKDMLVCVNRKPKFYARPGTLKNNLAVRIVDSVEDIEAIEGFGIHVK
jgi:flagellar motor switch protein FliM